MTDLSPEDRPTVRAPDSADDRRATEKWLDGISQRRASDRKREQVKALLADLSLSLELRVQSRELVRNPGRNERLARLTLVLLMAEQSGRAA